MTSGGMTSYSFSGEPDKMFCVDQEFVRLRGIVGPLWVSPPDTPGCQSSIPGYEGVIDLSGNVMEWEDACVEVGGGRHRCRMRGGSYLATDIRCATIDDEFMDDLHTSMGFRCCAY
jgi:formylglycine-generating enzyme